jgi:chemotaxis protein MotA
MDPATLIGIGMACVAVVTMMTLEGGSIGAIFLPAPLILVFFGSIGAAMAGGLLSDSKAAARALKSALLSKPASPDGTVEAVVALAERARREGLLALETAVREVEDPFLRQGLQAAIDGADPDELAEILSGRIDTKRKADHQAAKFFEAMGGYAPTVGIIGTVLGLVHVLENLSQPEKLGHLIAGAFVATLWGVGSANIMWLPIANRLKRLSDLDVERMTRTMEGVLAIQAGSQPRLLGERLRAMVPADQLAKAA